MKWVPRVKDRVENIRCGVEGEITEVNFKWGWFEVLWDDGRYKKYTMTSDNTVRRIKSAREKQADKRLREENLGLTDDWREYDA